MFNFSLYCKSTSNYFQTNTADRKPSLTKHSTSLRSAFFLTCVYYFLEQHSQNFGPRAVIDAKVLRVVSVFATNFNEKRRANVLSLLMLSALVLTNFSIDPIAFANDSNQIY